LWSVLILADAYNVDLEKEFTHTMTKLEARIAEKRSGR
jgi:NTP pyrophosphatase (non-canonical NTP hydrolase)